MTAPAPLPRKSGQVFLKPPRAAADLVHDGRERERAGCIPEALDCYVSAIAEAERSNEPKVLSEALRRLAVLRHTRDEHDDAHRLCQRSFEVAREAGHDLLGAEALNTLGVMFLREGALRESRQTLVRALELGLQMPQIGARVQQNLGILANIQGDYEAAMTHYQRSLEAYERLSDEHGRALAYHNLGMISAHCARLDDADGYFTRSTEIAERAGDVRLQGLCLLNHADVYVARQRYEDARRNAESSLVIFDQLGARATKADAYRIIGVVYRETGRAALAESRLKSAIQLASACGSLLGHAEATRELAILYQGMGRNQEALTLLNESHHLFREIDARRELVNVASKVEALETTYRAVVLEWGQSIESSDSYTFGHCERVADNAVAVAQAMGLTEIEQTTIRLGAYLHDVGKVKVPHEILNKAGPLTSEEFEVIQMHPVWGTELLENVEFPWDIKPIIRWHHEKYDGTGYPERLAGDEIPLSAQVVGIVDVYDALTTTRSYRPALTHERALAEMQKMRGSWAPRVFDAFMLALGRSRTADAQTRLPASSLAA